MNSSNTPPVKMTPEEMKKITDKYSAHLKEDTNAGSIEEARNQEKIDYAKKLVREDDDFFAKKQREIDITMQGISAETEIARAEKNAEVNVISDLSEKTRLEVENLKVVNNVEYDPLEITIRRLEKTLHSSEIISFLKEKLNSSKIEITLEEKNNIFLVVLKVYFKEDLNLAREYEYQIPRKIDFSNQSIKNLQERVKRKGYQSTYEEQYLKAFLKKIVRESLLKQTS